MTPAAHESIPAAAVDVALAGVALKTMITDLSSLTHVLRSALPAPVDADGRLSQPGHVVHAAAAVLARVEEILPLAVTLERKGNTSWDGIGQVLGTTRQTAWERFAPAVEAFEYSRPRLVPDNENLVEVVRRAQDVLEHVEAYEQDTADDAEPWQLPAPLAGSVALRALTRIEDVLRRRVGSFHDADRPPGARLFGPARRPEHTAVRPVVVDQADVTVLTEALTVATRALSPAARCSVTDPAERERLRDLAEVLDQFSTGGFRASWDAGSPVDATADLLQPLARLIALLELPLDDDAIALLDAMAPVLPGCDITMSPQLEAAYERLAGRFNEVLDDADPLARYRY
jgi:hypothetical protein